VFGLCYPICQCFNYDEEVLLVPDDSPLVGVRVLGLSRLLPGPYCSRILADFGRDTGRTWVRRSGGGSTAGTRGGVEGVDQECVGANARGMPSETIFR